MSSTSEILDIVLRSSLGKIISRDRIEKVVPFLRLKHWEAGTIIFSEQDPAEGFYVVSKGIVKLLRYRADGREIVVHFAEPTQSFAEAAIFLGRFPVTAVTDTDCELVYLPKSAVMEHLASDPEFSKFLMQLMATWLERLVEQLDTVVQNDASSRVIRFLLNEETPESKKSETRSVQLHFRKADMAQMLNMNQATLSRTLRKLQEEGLIKVKGRSFQLCDPKRLEAMLLPPLE